MIRLSPLFLAVSLIGCTATEMSPPLTPPPMMEEEEPVHTTTSYLRDIQPLIERSCLGCHTAGGAAPLAMDRPEDVIALAPAILGAVSSGRMPPFYASADCNSYEHDPRLSAAERALLEKWVGEKAPLGDPAEARHADEPIAPPVVRADRLMDLGGDFDVRAMDGRADNYRCFVMDPQIETDMMVTGYEVVPDNRPLVHHVLAYLVAPAQLGDLEANDAADEGPGYECFSGGIGVQGAVANQIAGWIPGGSAQRLPENTGLEIAAGSKIVIQIHYNLLALAPDASPMDNTQLALELAPAGSVETARILPILKRNLDIEAFDANSTQMVETPLPNAAGTTLFRLTGHMHMLGKQVKLEALHADGSSTCLLDIPAWDFQWQREYSLVTPFTVARGDRLRLTCVYDNSASNQPVVNGAQQQPRDVAWGESSLDEMCMTYLVFRPGR